MPNPKTVASCGLCAETRPIIARGLCSRCYQRAKVDGTLASHQRTARKPFVESLAEARSRETVDGCWPWPTVNRFGYPTCVASEGRPVGAHVAVWKSVNGAIPQGLQLDHLCHTDDAGCPGGVGCTHRRCVNPAHLEPVTHQEQQRRKHGYRSPTCSRDHDREGNTMWVRDVSGSLYRKCRTCHRENERSRA